MTPEPFDPAALRTDALTDASGRPIGRLLASRYAYGTADVGALVVELSDDVRRERRVREPRVQVAAAAVRLENGRPRLTLTLDELLDDRGVSHSDADAPRGKPEDRPPHFGASANETRAAGSKDGRAPP